MPPQSQFIRYVEGPQPGIIRQQTSKAWAGWVNSHLVRVHNHWEERMRNGRHPPLTPQLLAILFCLAMAVKDKKLRKGIPTDTFERFTPYTAIMSVDELRMRAQFGTKAALQNHLKKLRDLGLIKTERVRVPWSEKGPRHWTMLWHLDYLEHEDLLMLHEQT